VTITHLKALAEQYKWDLMYERGNTYLFRRNLQRFEVTCADTRVGYAIDSNPQTVATMFHQGTFLTTQDNLDQKILDLVTS